MFPIGFSKLTEREEYFIHGRYIFDKVNYIVDLGEKAVCHGVDQVKLKSIKKDFYDKLSGALNVERRQD